MPRLDPADLRAYAARDWSITDATDQDRIGDLESHCRVRSLLDRARHVGAR